MSERGRPSTLPPWTDWITLVLGIGPYACMGLWLAIKKLETVVGGLRRLDLGLPPLVAAPVFAMMSLVSYVALTWSGRRSRKQTIGLALAVLSLLGFLALCTPNPGGGRRRAIRTKCASNLKQIGYACRFYADDRDGVFPLHLASLFRRYIPDASVYVCPTVHRAGRVAAHEAPEDRGLLRTQSCYCYVSGLREDDKPESILAFDEEWNHQGIGINILRVGRSVEWHTDVENVHDQLDRQRARLAAKGRTMVIVRPSWSRWPARPEYPAAPWYERRLAHVLFAVGAAACLIGAALLVILRRGRPQPGTGTGA